MSALTHDERVSDQHARDDDRRTGAGLAGLVWLTWRQHRWAIVGSLVLAAGLTGWLAVLAGRIAAINRQCGYQVCAEDTSQYVTLHGNFGLLHVTEILMIVVWFLPLLVGVFLGVPLLAREHEQRTLLLAWSQDITPARWLWTKLILLGALTVALTAAVSVACDHLAHVWSIAAGESLFGGSAFQVTGMLPVALSIAWFAVGVALGAGLRRTLPSILSALGGFVGLLLLVQWRYPTFETPLTATTPVTSTTGKIMMPHVPANSLVIPDTAQPGSANTVDAAGHTVRLASVCPGGQRGNLPACMARHHLSVVFEYQPGSRIPDFHLMLGGGYLAIAVLALVATWWLVRRTSLSAG